MNKEEIFEILEEASAGEIDKYLDAVINRKRELYPDWDIWYMSMPKESEEEKDKLDSKLQELLLMDTMNTFYEFMRRKRDKISDKMDMGEKRWDKWDDLALLKEIMEEQWRSCEMETEE